MQFSRNIPKIVCVGRNYLDHIKELNNRVPSDLFYFLKPFSSLVFPSEPIRIPDHVEDLHYEVELAFSVSKLCKNVTKHQSWNYIDKYFICHDLTARCLQSKAKFSGLPWSQSKGFDGSLPISPGFTFPSIFQRNGIDPSLFPQLAQNRLSSDAPLTLFSRVNGELRQSGRPSQMIWDIPSILSIISTEMTLVPGDLILTGTPANVGPVRSGDFLSMGLSLDIDNSAQILIEHEFQCF